MSPCTRPPPSASLRSATRSDSSSACSRRRSRGSELLAVSRVKHGLEQERRPEAKTIPQCLGCNRAVGGGCREHEGAQMMTAIRETVEAWDVTQAVAAKRLPQIGTPMQ